MTLAGNGVYFLLPASLLRCLMRTAQSGILSMRVRRTRGAGWRTSSVRGTSRSRTSRWSRSAAASSTRRWRLVKLAMFQLLRYHRTCFHLQGDIMWPRYMYTCIHGEMLVVWRLRFLVVQGSFPPHVCSEVFIVAFIKPPAGTTKE